MNGQFIKGNRNALSHGMSTSREYRSWANMIQRCTNKNVSTYKDYGGRGIKVCARWKSFENFYEDMGPSNGLTLDRINNESDYSKENCRWITMKDQQNNRRNNRFFYFQGLNLKLDEWAKRTGIKRSTIAQRIYVYKWPIEKVLTQQPL